MRAKLDASVIAIVSSSLICATDYRRAIKQSALQLIPGIPVWESRFVIGYFDMDDGEASTTK